LRLAALLLVALVLASALAAVPAGGQESTATLYAEYYLPAVTEGNPPQGSLLLTTMNITFPGDGTIKVTSGGSVDEVTAYSIALAVKLAALLATVDWRTMNVYVHIDSPGGVGGPSGSAMTALVAYLLLAGAPRGDGYSWFTATGAISPEGLVASVGGVEYKCQAAVDAGLEFYYPLVNLTESLAQSCNGTTYTGILNLTSRVSGVPEPPPASTGFPLPASFNETMRQAAFNMANKTLQLLEEAAGLGVDDVQLMYTRMGVNKSLRYVYTHPYAAASLAFTSLLNATRIYYTAIAFQADGYETLNDEAARIEQELARLEETMNNMPRNGSIYYVEFLATAYTRLAAAKTSLLAYYNYSQLDPVQAVAELAHASARIDSIREWIASANASRLDRPRLGDGDIERLAWITGDYVETAANYSKALAQYMVETYGRAPTILVYIDIIDSLLAEARSYMVDGNYLAAIGFYREALSRSLNMLFQASLGAYRGPTPIIDDYIKELSIMYTYLSSRLLAAGSTPGLAPAYYDYALVLLGEGRNVSAVLMMEEAASSAILWNLLRVAKTSVALTTTIEAPVEQPAPPYNVMIVIVSLALTAFAIGYLSSVKAVSRILGG